MDSRKNSVSSKHLIAEQPGMKVLIAGLVISFFLGYTAKSLLAPSRVSARIEKAASHIHKDVKVTFDSAQVSLSDGIFPRFAVIISQVRMQSEKKCWASPVLEVDELRLPLSLWSLLQGQAAVPDIEADNVKVLLREDFQSCEQSQDQITLGNTSQPLVTLSPSEQAQKYQNDVRAVRVQKLTVASEKHPQFHSELLNFVVKVKSFEPKVIEVTAKTHLLKDAQVGDYLSHANLFLQYKESPDAQLQAHFFGNWREGHYSVIANYTIEDRLLSVETDLKHIPLSQILGILQKYKLASKELNGRQIWMSSKAKTISSVEKIRSSPIEVRDFRLEGDIGDIRVDRIDIKSLEPLQYAPISVDLKKLDIGKLLVFLNRTEKSSMLGELGTFTGRAEVVSDQKMKMTGEHTGLQFVFSNKGQRELQVVDRVIGDIALEDNDWNFHIKRVEPRGGNFIGDVRLQADRDFKELGVKARIEELSLASNVQQLMTQGGSIGRLSLDGDVRFKHGHVSFLKGLLRLDDISVEGMTLEKAKASLDYVNGDVVFNSQIKSMKVIDESPGASILKKVSDPLWWSSQELFVSTLAGRLHINPSQEFSWKNVQGQVGKSGKLTTEGSWSPTGVLKGVVQAKEGRNQRVWKIEGTRENPVFSEVSSKGVRK